MPVMAKSTGSGAAEVTDFEVMGVLGEGGMGRVLLARQKSLQRDVALKVLKADANNREVIDTLLAEAVITGSIEHPSIVPVHALGRDRDNLPVLVMKRIDGVSWRRLFENPAHSLWPSICVDLRDRLDAHLEILMAVCNAAHYAHSRGIVHRDIKLDNVMIGGFGEVYLVDWGIAVRVADLQALADETAMFGPPMGTLAYMAPEMAVGDLARIDARTDVYLLGATLHFLLTGTPRHRGEDTLDLLLSARDSEPVDYGPNVPAELAAICNRAMHVNPEQRFSSALELRQALLLFRRHRGSLALSAKAFAEMAAIHATEDVPERELRRVMTECRFAFMQALEAWPGNQPAREGLDKVLGRMVEYEIAQKDVEGAQALLSELAVERPDLEKRILALTAEIEAEKANAERLQAMARDADMRIGARFQLVIFAVLPSALLVAIGIFLGRGQNEVTERQLIAFPLVVILLLLGTFFVVRSRLTTAVSHRVFGFVVMLPLSMLAHRYVALARRVDIQSIVITDLVILTLVTAVFTFTIMPRMVMVAGIFLMGTIVAHLWPMYASHVFTVVALTVATVMLVMWTRLARSEQE